MTDDDQSLLIENAALALLENAQFLTLLGELQKIRDVFEKRHVVGLDPTSDPLLVQRNIGYMAGIDCLLQTPGILASGKLREAKTRKHPAQSGRGIPPLEA